MKQKNKNLMKTCVLFFLFVCATAAPCVFAQDGPPESQTIGVGLKFLARDGSTAGVNARFWTESNFGVEGGFLFRSNWNSIPISGLYTLAHLNYDSVYIRPYVGGGVSINRWKIPRYDPYEGRSSSSETKIGGQGFAGAEFTVKSFPKLSFGADLGYHRLGSFGEGDWKVGVGGFAFGLNVLYYLK